MKTLKFINILIGMLITVYAPYSMSDGLFKNLFPKPKPIIGAVIIPGVFVDEGEEQPTQAEITKYALSQLNILEQTNVEGVLFEFGAGGIENPKFSEDKMEMMAEIMKAVVNKASHIVVGVEILWHYPRATLMLAKLSGAKFVRIDFFVDHMFANGVKVPVEPKALQDFRKSIKAQEIAIFTDIQVKYAQMLDPRKKVSTSAREARKEGSDGVIVTGRKSGSPPKAKKLRWAKSGADDLAVIIGSGFSYSNAHRLLPVADAVIVGTSISTETGGPLVPWKVKRLMEVVNSIRNKN